MTNQLKIITHDGVFHADDVVATAVLRLVHPGIPVERTRDRGVLFRARETPGTYLLDIGGVYNPEMGHFDHHQPEGAGFRNVEAREWPYATAGLIWKHFGAQAVRSLQPALTEVGVAETVQHLDDSVIKYIDAVDCGVRIRSAGPSLSALISCFNPAWYEREEDNFPLVLELAQALLVNFIKRHAGKILARDSVRQSARTLDGRVLLLEACLPWTDVVTHELTDILLVIYPVESQGRQQWQVRTANEADASPRIQFPEAWAGLEHKALARASGVPSAVFCHRSRHLAGALDLAGALTLSDAVLAQAREPLPLAA